MFYILSFLAILLAVVLVKWYFDHMHTLYPLDYDVGDFQPYSNGVQFYSAKFQRSIEGTLVSPVPHRHYFNGLCVGWRVGCWWG